MMQRFIIEYTISNSAESWDHVHPILAESKEEFLHQFEMKLLEMDELDAVDDVIICSQSFWLPNFREHNFFHSVLSKGPKWTYVIPSVYTVDEWFEKNLEKQQNND